MPRNYSPSTIDVIGDLHVGLRVETGVFAAATYINHTTNTGRWDLFNVHGRILLKHLFIEAITVFGAGASVLLFSFESTTPVIGVQNICGACASVAALPQGGRIVWVGGAVATLAVITVAATGGVSDVIPTAPHYIGTKAGVGVIGMFTATATLASGTAQAVCCYAPLSDGAYVEANALPVVP
ncbi:MAG: hypothetical protein ABIJ57_05820 [Pseudomonadota bacterium]